MAQIPQNFIHDLLAHVDIIEVISPRLNLRKAGNNYLALCPFHNEKTPSFSVNPRKQFYHCFGCGASGNAISFLMDFDKLEFVEAIETLAATVGLEVPKTENSSNQAQFTQLYILLEKVNDFYRAQLTKSVTAQNYLKQRGISSTICKRFAVGYAPAIWEHLNHFYTSSSATKQQLFSTGMLSNNEAKNTFYARFRNRIMFPIRNKRGNIIGFGGRSLGEEIPKYLNSPETILFHKGNELYGLYEAKQSNRNLNQIIVVEGYMDVIALAQYGITNVVATLGTAISTKQIQQLLRVCSRIFFCFDGDAAGKAAAWRALENSLPLLREGFELRFLFLPETEDPDTMIRKEGAAAFIQRLDNSTPLSDFLFQQVTNNININTLEGRAKLIETTKQLLLKMANGVFKQMLMARLAELAKIDLKTIQENEATNFTATPTSTTNNSAILISPLQTAVGLLLNHPELAATIDQETLNIITKLDSIEATLFLQLTSLLKDKLNANQSLSLGTIFEHWRDHPDFAIIAKIASWEPLIPQSALKNEFNATINTIRNQGLDQIIHSILQTAKTRDLTSDEKIKLQNLIKLTKNNIITT